MRLAKIREAGLFRELRRVNSAQKSRLELGEKSLLNFSSNDYLGLADEPALKEAAIRAVERYGAGSGASRLICGSLAPHHQLEELLAEFKQCEAALSFSSGYAAAVGTICALAGKDDVIILDKLVHASIVDAARLSGARLRIFDHNDLSDLEKILQWADKSSRAAQVARRFVITESIFSMDGDAAPLRDLVALKNKYGAWLMVDEAHATGLYGKNRCGLAEDMGVADQIEIQMGTLGKAVGASGGYICGSRALIDFLVNRARSFIFSTAPVPAASAAAFAGLQFIRSNEGAERRQKLWELIRQFEAGVSGSPFLNADVASAIIPIILGDEAKAVDVAAALRDLGIFVPAIRYPTVARGRARLRVTLTASHTAEDLEQLQKALRGSKLAVQTETR